MTMLKQQKDLELNNPISAFARAVPGSECHELTTHCNASVNRVNACNKSKLSRLSCTKHLDILEYVPNE